MQTMEIGGRTFPVVGNVTRETAGQTVPAVDIPMTSDYKWQLTALRDRLEDPEKYRAIGEDVEAVIAQLRHWLEEHRGEVAG